MQGERQEAQKNLYTRKMMMATLLYTEKGMVEAAKIWRAFESMRFEYERMTGEDQEAEEAVEEWGYGELEAEEGRRREVNGEYELAMRGCGE